MKIFLISTILILLGSLQSQAQQIDPVCLRLEGLHLPCLSGGHGTQPPPGCSGQTVPNAAACEELECSVPVEIQGTVATNERGSCREYSYQCSGEYQGDGCRASCQVSGNSCVVQNSCGSLPPGFRCELSTGCGAYNYNCVESNRTCYEETVMEPGHAVYDPATKCCKCKRKYVPKCSTC